MCRILIRDYVERLGPLVWCRQTDKMWQSLLSAVRTSKRTDNTNWREGETYAHCLRRQEKGLWQGQHEHNGERERQEERLSLPEGRERGPRTDSGWAPEKTERRERTRRRNWGERDRDTHTNISRLVFLRCIGNQCDQLASCDRALTMATHWKTESEYENLKKHNFKSAVCGIGQCRESELKATHSPTFNFL